MTEATQETRGCALVTGASRGIGRAIALRLAELGYDVAACYRQAGDAARETEAAIRALGVRTLFCECDVADGGAVDEFVNAAGRELGPIEALVCNAGVVRDANIVSMQPADWSSVIATNLTGTWNFCRAVSFRMLKARRGAIVNLSSIAGVYGNAGQSNYAASKAGIIGMSRSIAKELAPFGVRVNVVAPGFIETDMTSALQAKARDKALGQIPLRRFGEVNDVAELVAFLLSERAKYIVGQVIQVDGGMVL